MKTVRRKSFNEQVSNEDVRFVSRFSHAVAAKSQLYYWYRRMTEPQRTAISYIKAQLPILRHDKTVYRGIPYAKVQYATFNDFLGIQYYYLGRLVDRHNEAALLYFLSRCTKEYGEFYLKVFQGVVPAILWDIPIKPRRHSVNETTEIRYFSKTGPRTLGAIEGLWVEDGVPKGFNVWHKTRLIQCSYPFEPDDYYLEKKTWCGKLAHLQMPEQVVKEVLMGEPRFMLQPVTFITGEQGYLERCGFCGRDHTEVKHRSKGLCCHCVHNLDVTFRNRGPEKWFTATPALKKVRRTNGWTPEMANRLGYILKGYRLFIARDWRARFRTDPEAMEIYLKNKEEREQRVVRDRPEQKKYGRSTHRWIRATR